MGIIKKISVIILSGFVMLSLGSCSEEEVDNTRSYISVEINPAVEMVLDADDKVVAVNGLDDAGEMLVVDVDLVGDNVDDAVEKIIKQAKSCGYVSPEGDEIPLENNIKISVSSTNSDEIKKLENILKNKIQRVITREKLNTKYEKLESKKREYFVSIAKQYNPTLTSDVVSKMSEEELMAIVELATIEKAQLVSIELEKYYLSLKEYEFQLQYKELISKKLESLSSVTATVYTAAINSLKTSIEQINKIQYDIFVSENSDYLKLLQELNLYKDKNMVLSYKISNGQTSDDSGEYSLEIEINKEKIKEIEMKIIAIMNLVNANLEVIKKNINNAISILTEQEKNISNVNYNEILTSVEKTINDTKNGLLSKFEEKYANEIAYAKSKMIERKTALVKCVK